MAPDDFYQRYYRAIAVSQANSWYCQRLFGLDLAQHGFAEMAHLDHLLAVAELQPRQQALDLGCGNGGIAEYLAKRSGTSFTGIDLEPEAIRQAQARRAANPDLNFQVMDMCRLEFPPASFDGVTAIDTLYFVPLDEALPGILRLLKPGGRLVAFWTQAADPETPLGVFDVSTIHPDRSELAVALQKLGLAYQTWDYSQADLEHARRKLEIAEALRPNFEAEGNQFLYQNHIDEARGVLEAGAAGAHARFLYRVRKPKTAPV
jgi:cyclopropane fatty-acyl-phospholipid synthase-like methyltransferase